MTNADGNNEYTDGAGTVAVIGMSCRLPQAPDPDAFWRLLRDGVDAVGPAPAGREAHTAGLPGGYLDEVDAFDAAFFGISPREAGAMDPRQRLALELAWEALQDARIVPERLRGSRTGVYVGSIWDDYGTLAGRVAPGEHTMAGLHRGIIANRVSYVLGLRGPSLIVDTGQSSSLVAVQLACESLRRGETGLALAGGLNVILAPESTLTAQRFGGLSPDGRCFTFDERANGFVRGEGGAVLVLKLLSRALADGDRVYAVLAGGAVNNDGPGEALTVPSRTGQEEVLREAYERSGVPMAAVRYVELHGTGTRVGDPVEAAALGATLGAGRDASTPPLPVGSVKTNIGHLEGAAGIVGLLKVVLSMWHRQLPPSLHFRAAAPGIPLPDLGLRVQTELTGWPQGDGPLVAGVSSFGMGGTNCHVVVTAAPEPRAQDTARDDDRPMPFVVSGRTAEGMRAQATRLREHLLAAPDLTMAAVAGSLATTRGHLPHRAAVVADGRAALLDDLAAVADGRPARAVTTGTASRGGTVFMLPGQGAQWAGTARELIATSEAFREHLHACADALAPHAGWSLLDVLAGRPGAPALDRVDVAQPALFAVTTSLARLWLHHGVEPAAVVGHSDGEIAAAYVADALTLDDAARVVARRAQALHRIAGTGATVTVALPADRVAADLTGHPELGIAGSDGPRSTVVAGPLAAVEALITRYAGRNVDVRRGPGHAAHSAQVEPLRDELLAGLAGIEPRPGQVPFWSTTTATVVETSTLDARYWYDSLRRPVRFQQALEALSAAGHTRFVEVSAHPVLTGAARETLDAAGADDVAVLPTLRRDDDGPERFLISLAGAYTTGADPAWSTLVPAGAPVDLPTQAFVRKRFWLPQPEVTTAGAGAAEAGPAETVPAGPAAVRLVDLAGAERLVRGHAAAVLGLDGWADVDPALTFKDLGFDSTLAVELAARLGAETGLPVSGSAVFDLPTVRLLAAHLRDELAGAAPVAAEAAPGAANEPIAIVATACRLPGDVRSPDDLWRLVAGGTDAISGFPENRGWDLEALRAKGCATGSGGFLHDADEFDAGFFDLSPREAVAMDPQQRLLLQTSWEALERAGIDPASLAGEPVGVFVGAMPQEYGPRLADGDTEHAGMLLTGTTGSVASGRIAYVLGLQGPAITVDTACSSSLVAIHLAVRALRAGECGMALAGGVSVMAAPGIFMEFSRQGGLAPDGRCKAFGADADGTAWAEGVGMLVLERLSDAQAAGHEVLAVIRGSAVNNDGASNGLTAPNGRSQQRAIRLALADAAVDAAEVDAVEAHGTGTRLGDPIEAQALLATYGAAPGRPADRPLLLGSLKSNIGHAQAAAGVAGVIKMVEAVRRGELPRTLHADLPSSFVDWDRGGVALLTGGTPWPAVQRPRRAAVSSFGISGTNAHLILEQAPATAAVDTADDPAPVPMPVPVPWVVSAKTPAALQLRAEQLAGHLAAHPGDPARVGWTLSAGRGGLPHRAAVLGRDHAELLAGLRALAAGDTPDAGAEGVAGTGRVVFVFPGQGAQWREMAAGLLDDSPAFAERIADCAAALEPYVDWSLTEVLRDRMPGWERRVDVVQPALWAVMIGLAELWRRHGVRPDAVVGHSQGEIAAACVAGALSLADGARIVALRSRALTALAGTGTMAAVSLPAGQVRERIGDVPLHVAVCNGPSSTVVAGPAVETRRFVAACVAGGVRAKLIDVDYASHGPAVESLREELTAALGSVTPAPAAVPLYSTVTGEPVDAVDLDAGYWWRNLREPVRFDAAVRALARDGHTLFVEVSPHPVLTTPVEETLARLGVDGAAVGTLRRDHGGAGQFRAAVAHAYTCGASVDWTTVFGPSARRLVELPTYPFERQRYWLTPVPGSGDPASLGLAAAGHPLLGATVPLAEGDAVVLTGRLSEAAQPWLADHAVAGTVLFPATGFLELALHAAEVSGAAGVEELVIEAPLELPAGTAAEVQVTAGGPDDTGARRVTVHARTGDGPWTRHAAGTLAAQLPAHPAMAQIAGGDPVDLAGCYERLAATGYGYGPAFQGLHHMWRAGTAVHAEVTGAAEVADGLSEDGYGVHPATLDAALHALILDRDRLELPFVWQRVRRHRPARGGLRVRITPAGPDLHRLEVADATGAAVLTADVGLRPVPSAGPALLEVRWEAVATPAASGTYPRLAGLDLSTVDGVVVLAAPAGDVHEVTAAVLAGVQGWLAEPGTAAATLAVVTAGGTRPALGDRVADPAQAALWGLLRTVQTEHPDRFVLLDVPPGTAGTDVDAAVAATVAAAEPQAAWRRGELFVPRLQPAPVPLSLPEAAAAPWRLAAGTTGTVDGLTVAAHPAAGAPLRAGEVRVAVRAVGVNFRDVLIALGMYPEPEHVGSEAAGVVTEVGPDVTGIAVGDRVLGPWRGATGPVAVVDAELALPVPDGWSFAEAAAVPVVYATAYHALVNVAAVQPGERVLIHAAAGGVGFAATQIARLLGAEVYGTASPAKHPMLLAAGFDEAHLASSRTLEFAGRFGATAANGMDVVLNCLAGEFTDASLNLVAPDGRFVEIGKTDLRPPEQLAASHPWVRYRPFDLFDLPAPELREMLVVLLHWLRAGQLTLPPVTTFDLRQAGTALRHVQHAAHVGKVVLTVPRPLPADGTVLVTGGTGGLGAHLAEHLVRVHGVRHLLLVSRSGPAAPGAAALVERLEALGAAATVAACDTADRGQLRRLLARVPAERPLSAVVHAAGVLRDAPVTGLTPEHLAAVLRPKTDAAAHLDALTRDLDLAAFVLFSSVIGTIGGAGQANYAAANTWLDALAQARAATGRPATSIAWGLWDAGSGMTGGLSRADLDRLRRGGLIPIPVADGLALFDAALAGGLANVVAASLDRAALAAADVVPPPLRGLVRPGPATARVAANRGAGRSGWRREFAAAPAGQRQAMLVDLVRAHTATVLAHPDPAAIDAGRAFKELGFDSLTSVELRNRLAKATGLSLPVTVVFAHPSIAALAAQLHALIEETAPALEPPPEPVAVHPAPSMREPIAIVGMACRYPGGVRSPEDLWRLVAAGQDAVGPFPDGRGWAGGQPYARVGGFVEDADAFDAELFGISPREALAMDPQQRLLLQIAWEAFERAGMSTAELRGSRTAVYAGVIAQEYGPRTGAPAALLGHLLTGMNTSVASGRLAYTFGLEGPAVTVDTACSSSLVAIHLAVQALRSGECDAALAGGVTVIASPTIFDQFHAQGGLAADGRCKPFSAEADGTGFGDGAGVVILQRLSDALAQGRTIHALIRGTATNSDGASNGL
ncbi:SDR family NAD(P)-dependent oxidoreductase, partial [Dactylosporangium sp. NPDC049525]|uniref:SDR family NAD(P)-dependent oxidoreductase n=1 Tax=Dactylosporangium sp. NPDC049525 TaxID=3154730 RepID=UPI003447BEBE